MTTTIVPATVTDHKAQTHNATVANIFRAKAKHDQLVQEAMERTARETPSEAGNLLWI